MLATFTRGLAATLTALALVAALAAPSAAQSYQLNRKFWEVKDDRPDVSAVLGLGSAGVGVGSGIYGVDVIRLAHRDDHKLNNHPAAWVRWAKIVGPRGKTLWRADRDRRLTGDADRTTWKPRRRGAYLPAPGGSRVVVRVKLNIRHGKDIVTTFRMRLKR